MPNRPDRSISFGRLPKWLIYKASNVQELLDGCLIELVNGLSKELSE